MRAAVLHEYGVPRFDEFEEPEIGPEIGSEQAIVEVLAAGLNPVDVAICAGRFYAGKPPLPSVAFGEPFAAALGAASFGARVVQIGASAGAETTVPSAPIRGKMLVIMGHTNFAAPPEVKRKAYERMAREAVAGRLRVDTYPLPLERLQEAWQRLQAGWHRKIVLVP